MRISRRHLLLGGTTLGLAACAPGPARGPGGAEVCLPGPADDLAGFDAAALRQCLDDFARSPVNYHALLVERAGRIAAEVYRRGHDAPLDQHFPTTTSFDACTLHDLRSISKSVTGLLWGIAAAGGMTPSLNTPVLDFYPELAALRTDGREAITLEHLLTMSTGLQWNEDNYTSLLNDEFGLYWHGSQARHTFNRPMVAKPGTVFNYCGGATAIIADVLSRALSMTLPDYAQQQLFTPLGIGDWSWARDYRGRAVAFAGLRLRPRDLLRIGRVMLDGGRWQGRSILPQEWIAQSIQPHMAAGDGLHYGYFWWLGEVEALGGRHPYVAGFGNGGQRLFLVPDLDVCVVITAGNYDRPEGALSQQLFRGVMRTLHV